ncbi:MAG: DUF2867 domain-containing protein [Bacteroidales bacterium]|jgi:hypothetical protein|nr:DUF2867 domain-containing protein [Bacteroidales bacterium]
MSKLKFDEKSFHYIDSYMGQYLTNSHDYTITDIGELFFNSGPKWADFLMSIRDKIVGLFGLKTASTISEEERNHVVLKFEEGEQLNIFKLYSKSESELIMGDDDKHLNFRVSLLLDSTDVDSKKKKILITTVVTYRNWLGKIYFIPVKPFHTLIVKETMKRMIQKIESDTIPLVQSARYQ